MQKVVIALLTLITLGVGCSPNTTDPSVTYGSDTKFPQQFIRGVPEGVDTARLARLDAFLSSLIEDGTLPYVATFIARDGYVIHQKEFGEIAPGKPLDSQAIFRIASQTKPLVSVAMMQLYERGLFLLDDPVSAYIPAFENPTVLTSFDKNSGAYSTRPATRPITIRHLLTHTAGFVYGHPIYHKAGIPMLNSMDSLTIKQMVETLATLPLMHDPGDSFSYGLHTDILGYLVEVLSGMPLDDYLQRHILAPLDMDDSYFYLPDEKASRLVPLYQHAEAGNLSRSTHPANTIFPVAGAKMYLSGGAGMVGTIEDYAAFCQMLANGGTFNNRHILSPHTLRLMTTNQIGELEVWDRKEKFGLGFALATEKSLQTVPGSLQTFRWGGVYATDFVIDPAENLIILVYTNVHPFYYYDNLFKRCRILAYQALIRH